MAKASLGAANIAEIDGVTVFFADNVVVTHTRLDLRNLARIKYLNLRHSSISDL